MRNIDIYPQDKIYSDLVGVWYPAASAGADDEPPVPPVPPVPPTPTFNIIGDIKFDNYNIGFGTDLDFYSLPEGWSGVISYSDTTVEFNIDNVVEYETASDTYYGIELYDISQLQQPSIDDVVNIYIYNGSEKLYEATGDFVINKWSVANIEFRKAENLRKSNDNLYKLKITFDSLEDFDLSDLPSGWAGNFSINEKSYNFDSSNIVEENVVVINNIEENDLPPMTSLNYTDIYIDINGKKYYCLKNIQYYIYDNFSISNFKIVENGTNFNVSFDIDDTTSLPSTFTGYVNNVISSGVRFTQSNLNNNKISVNITETQMKNSGRESGIANITLMNYKVDASYEVQFIDFFYIENITDNNISLSITVNSGGSVTTSNYATKIYTSPNRLGWTLTNLSGSVITINPHEKLYFKNYSVNSFSYRDSSNASNYYTNTIRCNGNFNVGGELYTLLNYSYTNSPNITPKSGAFHQLFDCTSPYSSYNSYLKDASNLKFNKLNASNSMCYLMFKDCRGMITPPPIINSTVNTYSNYGMFQYCTNMTTPPQLPATTLSERCYGYMFSSCWSMTEGPVLPATTLVDYCYNSMFSQCSVLNSITTYANDISAPVCIQNWLQGVSQTGTFHNLGSATYPTDSTSGIPSGWTVVNN